MYRPLRICQKATASASLVGAGVLRRLHVRKDDAQVALSPACPSPLAHSRAATVALRGSKRAPLAMGTSALLEARRFLVIREGNAASPLSSALTLRSACDRYLVSTARLERAAQPSTPLPKLANLFLIDARNVSRQMKDTVTRHVLAVAELHTIERDKAQARVESDDGVSGSGSHEGHDSTLVDEKLMLAPLVLAVKTNQTLKKARELQRELEDVLLLRGLAPATRVVVLDKQHSKAASRLLPSQSTSTAALPDGFVPGKRSNTSSSSSSSSTKVDVSSAAGATIATATAAAASQPQQHPQRASDTPRPEDEVVDEEEYEEVVEEVEVDEDEEGDGSGEVGASPAVLPTPPPHPIRSPPDAAAAAAAAANGSGAREVDPDLGPSAEDKDEANEGDVLVSEVIPEEHLPPMEPQQPKASEHSTDDSPRQQQRAAAEAEEEEGSHGVPEAPSSLPPSREPEQQQQQPPLEVPASLREAATYYTGASTVYLSDRAVLDLPAVANVLVLDATKALQEGTEESVLSHLTDVGTPFGYLLASPDTFVPAEERTIRMDANALKVSMLPKVFVFRTSFPTAVAKRVRTAMAQALNGVSGHERNRVCVLDAANSEAENPLEAPPPRYAAPPSPQPPHAPEGSPASPTRTEAEAAEGDEDGEAVADADAAATVAHEGDEAAPPVATSVDQSDEAIDDTPPEEEAVVEAALTSPYRVFSMFGRDEVLEPVDRLSADSEIRSEAKDLAETVDVDKRDDGDDGDGDGNDDGLDEAVRREVQRAAVAGERVQAATSRPRVAVSDLDAEVERIQQEMLRAKKAERDGPSSFLTLSPDIVLGGRGYASTQPVGQRRRAEGVAYARYKELREATRSGADSRSLLPVPIIPPRSGHAAATAAATASGAAGAAAAAVALPKTVRGAGAPTRSPAPAAAAAHPDGEFIPLRVLQRVNPGMQVGTLVENYIRYQERKKQKAGQTLKRPSTPATRTSTAQATDRPVTVASVILHGRRKKPLKRKTPAAQQRKAAKPQQQQQPRHAQSKRTAVKPAKKTKAQRARAVVAAKAAQKAIKRAAVVAEKSLPPAATSPPPQPRAAQAASPPPLLAPKRTTYKTKSKLFNLPHITISVLEMRDDVAVLSGPLNESQRRALLRKRRAQWRKHKPASPATGVTTSALSLPQTVSRSERIAHNSPRPIREAIHFIKLSARSPPGEKRKAKKRAALRVDDYLLERQDVLNALCEGTVVYPRAHTERCLQPYFPSYAGRQSEIRSLAPVSTVVCVSENMLAGASARNPFKVAMSEWAVEATVASVMAALTAAAYDNGDMQEVLKRNRQLGQASKKYVPLTVLILRNGVFTAEECREQQQLVQEALQRQRGMGNTRAFVVPRV